MDSKQTNQIVPLSWDKFKAEISELFVPDNVNSLKWIFRGQGCSTWRLVSKLDRLSPNCTNRFDLERNLIREFFRLLAERGESIDPTLSMDRDELDKPELSTNPESNSVQIFARHHGIPTLLLDWTSSPYIAAFFAFWEMPRNAEESVSIWVADREGIAKTDEIEIIDPTIPILRSVRRVAAQRGLFTRVKTSSPDSSPDLVERLSTDSLFQIQLPSGDREWALNDLDAMGINAANLYGTIDSTAAVIEHRVFQKGGMTA